MFATLHNDTWALKRISIPGAPQETSSYAAAGGRVVFGVRYDTLADVLSARHLFTRIEAAGLVNKETTAPFVINIAAELCAYLTTISWLDVPDLPIEEQHPEIARLMELVSFWASNPDVHSIDVNRLWNLRLSQGMSLMGEWQEARNRSQAISLRGPRALLPDEALTDQELSDPNSVNGGGSSDPKSVTTSSKQPLTRDKEQS